jgi:putative ABC transport system permease protein
MSNISRGNIKMALASVRSAKWRSMLTMLGVIIGIVSVVMVVGIGEGVKQEIAHDVNQYGKDLITIRPGTVRNGQTVTNADLLFGLNSVNGLSASDLQVIRNSAHVRLAAPMSLVSGSVSAGGQKMNTPLVIATNGDLPGVLNRPIPYGDFFSGDTENQDVAVLGKHLTQNLFNDYVPLGNSFTFRGTNFIVRGIFDDFQSAPLSPSANFNDAIFIPYNVAQRITGNNLSMYSILVKPDDPKNTQAAIDAINKNLLQAHGGEHDFSVLNQQQNIASSSDVLDLITTMIAAIAAISLLVGGVGIMNIMLASVTERTHEIGVRKAIGATNRQILNQFMLESAVLSLFGGIVGIVISLGGVLLLRVYTSLKPVVSWEAIVIATSASLLIGIVFGVAPAIKAARKDPIEALRHD